MITLSELNKDLILQTKTTHISYDKKNIDILNAMKALKSALVKYEKDSGEVTEQVVVSTIQKMIKQREESSLFYEKAGHSDKKETEQNELNYLKSLIPQVSDEEIKSYTLELAKEIENISMKDMKSVLTRVKEKFPTADGKIVSEVIKSLL